MEHSLVLFSSHYFQFAEDAGYTFTLTIFDHNMNILYSNSFLVVSMSLLSRNGKCMADPLSGTKRKCILFTSKHYFWECRHYLHLFSCKWIPRMDHGSGEGGGIAFFWIAMVLFFVGICDAFIVMRSSSKNRMRSIPTANSIWQSTCRIQYN